MFFSYQQCLDELIIVFTLLGKDLKLLFDSLQFVRKNGVSVTYIKHSINNT